MLSISDPLKGSKPVQYYMEQVREDYYITPLKQPGQWAGCGAELLGLRGTVERTEFRNLLLGFSPDGVNPFVQNAGRENRQSGWDLTFSAPKSVSVFWAMATPEVRHEVEVAHQQALTAALAYVEAQCGLTRRGRQGHHREPAAMIFATFQHTSSRDLDPQLHTHAVLLNLGLRQDGTSGTLMSKPFFQQKMTIGVLYRAELSAQLRERLGLLIEAERVGFHLTGVPRELCREFSKRRRAIESAMKLRGTEGAIAAKVAALETRQPQTPISPEELLKRWQKCGELAGWGTSQAMALVRRQAISQEPAPVLALELCQAAEALPPESQEHSELLHLATQLAIRNGAGARSLIEAMGSLANPENKSLLQVHWRRLFDPSPWLPPQKRWIRFDWKQPFPNAAWDPVQRLRLPVLVVELPRFSVGPPAPFKPRWRTIRWKKELPFGEVRVQDRVLFPNAPKWSPVHGLSLPALKISPRKSQPPPKPPRQGIHHSH